MDPNVERHELKGLCMTCNHAGFCSHLARATSAIWWCEEFDDSGPVRSRSEVVVALVSPSPSSRTQPSVPRSTPPGLCANCTNLPCALPKSPTGVWHCEEYQ